MIAQCEWCGSASLVLTQQPKKWTDRPTVLRRRIHRQKLDNDEKSKPHKVEKCTTELLTWKSERRLAATIIVVQRTALHVPAT